MPELPEVETVRRSLEPGLYEGEVTEVSTSALALRQRPIDRAGLQTLIGARFLAARRHGKYLMLDATSGASLVVHLGMSGRLLLVDSDASLADHTHVTLDLSSGRALRYVDPRRFGIVRIYPTSTLAQTEELAGLGPDPLAGSFDAAVLGRAMAATRRDLKAVLLDQTVLAGLGNIYVSEALFEARLSPKLRAHRLKPAEIRALAAAIAKVLTRAVKNRGTSLSDYVDAAGESGWNQNALRVYERSAEPCRRCKTLIRRIVQAGRSTYYCPGCQGRGVFKRSAT